MQCAILTDRTIIAVMGEDAGTFLQGLLTNDIITLQNNASIFAALLSPQGKILCDMIISRTEGGFLVDCRRDGRDALIERMTIYKLRSKVSLEKQDGNSKVVAAWHGVLEPGPALHPDPRLPALGWRAITDDTADIFKKCRKMKLDDYHTHRIACAVPEGGMDFIFDNTFPHEANMDQLHGISFNKGCYIGQEVVARMHHRGTARKRIIPIEWDGQQPPAGSAIKANSIAIGITGSSSTDGKGLAMLRIDRVQKAMLEKCPLTAAKAIIKPVFQNEGLSI